MWLKYVYARVLTWYIPVGSWEERPANCEPFFPYSLKKVFLTNKLFNCDCRLRIDPSAAVYFPDFSRLYYSRKWQNVRWIDVWPDKWAERDKMSGRLAFNRTKWDKIRFISSERFISHSIKYPSISEATSGIKARMTLSSFWCRLPASSMLPNHRIDLSMLHN